MRHYIICIFLFTAIGTQAQQVNPVPDYVFRNQMSVGRNAVTDTAAYISIGPRYGANKGLMPPIVSDTAAITGVKRNGLLIFSVQRNNFQYWDSINSRWTSVTANVDTTIISTRAWRKKGDDSLGAVIATKVNISDTATMLNPYTRGSGTVNALPLFTGTRTLGNSQVLDSAAAGVSIGTKTLIRTDGPFITGANISGRTNPIALGTRGVHPIHFYTSDVERLRIFANGRVGVNTTTDAGYQFDVAGSIRNTTDAYFATSSGNVGIGTTSPRGKLDVSASGNLNTWLSSYFTGTVAEPFLNIFRSNNNTIGSLTTTVTGQSLGRIVFHGVESGGAADDAAYIRVVQDGTAGSLRVPAYMEFATGDETNNPTPRLRIQKDGLIGIATTSPSEALDVNGRIRARTIDSTSSPINVLTSDVNGVIRKTAPGVQGSGTTNYIPKFTASGTIGNSILQDDGTRLFTAASTTAGNLFLGTNTYTTFGGYKYIVLSNTTGAVVSFAINGTEQAAIALNGSTSFNIAASANIPIGFFTNSNERMRVTGDGELLINTTTDVGDYRLQVNGNANFRDDVLIDTNLRVNRHISLDQSPKAWALGNAIEGPQGSTLFVAGGGVQTLANVYYDGSYKYSTSNPGAAMFLLQSGITFATYGSGTANGALTGANEMVYAGGELRVGIADQGTFKLQVADKSYFGDEVQIASTTDLGNYKLQVTGEAIITAGIRTDAPSGGTAATWKLGTVATVSPTSPNRTIEVEIGGTTYYIHAKTTNN